MRGLCAKGRAARQPRKSAETPGGIPKSSALLRKFNQLSNFSIWLNRLAIVFDVFQNQKSGLSAAFLEELKPN